jgi:hypothetical protein
MGAWNFERQHGNTFKINIWPDEESFHDAHHRSHVPILTDYKANASLMPNAIAHH